MSGGEPGDLLAAVRADPIIGPYADALERHARPSIRLRSDRGASRYVGESRVGGWPDVPEGFQWPTRHVRTPTPSAASVAGQYFGPLSPPTDMPSTFGFIAQIDLSSVTHLDRDGLLPHEGTLLFFYHDVDQADVDQPPDLTPMSWPMRDDELEVGQREAWFDEVEQTRVIHVPGGVALEPSLDGPTTPYSLQLVASQDVTLPSVLSLIVAKSTESTDESAGQVVLPPDAWMRLAEIAHEHRANADIDQMLGWADNSAHGPSMPPEPLPGMESNLASDLFETQDARLLLQLSPATYEPTGIRFGRTLYFYARESDLRRGDFSRAWYDSD